jgi:signal transduction histidine kinase
LIGNILDNAHDAIFEMSLKQKKEYKPVIDIETWSDIEHVYFSIKDNGNGITNENIKKIFNPLFTTKTSKTGNTGMGLSLAYIIAVDRHHGDIKVESKVGQGSKFIIKLPRIHHKPDSGEGNSNE